jgi:hypothetical protein
MKMHRNSKLFLAAVFIGCASGIASADNDKKQLGPPSPIGKVIAYTPPPAPLVSKSSVPYGPPCLSSPVTTAPLVVNTAPPLTKAPAFGFDPFTLSSSEDKDDKSDKDGRGKSVVVVAEKFPDASHRPDRSPGDKDHDHDGDQGHDKDDHDKDHGHDDHDKDNGHKDDRH